MQRGRPRHDCSSWDEAEMGSFIIVMKEMQQDYKLLSIKVHRELQHDI